MTERILNGGRALVVPLIVLAIWYWVARNEWLPEQLLPPPALVWVSFTELVSSGELQFHLLTSLGRLAISLALGTCVAVVLAVAMAISLTIKNIVFPSFNLLAQFPVIGWVPILVICVGIDEALKISVIGLAVLAPVTLNLYRGIVQIPAQLVEAAQVLQLPRLKVFTQLIIPATLPNLFTGLRQGLMQAWLTLVFVELLASSEGLGYLMVWGRQLMQLDLIVVSMIVIGLIGFGLDSALSFIEALLQPWQFRRSETLRVRRASVSRGKALVTPPAPTPVAASTAPVAAAQAPHLVGLSDTA